ncbi:hypothetical protein FRD01_16795 [Microvenator marinus]|uniref:Immunity MXAN-0049 protein domain-containing protein n=1 Tax=Microvenator marinus TaxID=2600177 RepID=A0A5B8XUN8_9DELT|nr:DUF1629 domain-containing protein [Microvenator marinus]QED28867.1 hypothetical protein FRD01_16795 [Microvenator marinus]
MSKYFVLDCHPPLEAEFYNILVPYPANDRRWEAGVLFSVQDRREGFRPPTEPIEIQTEPEIEPPPRIYAELLWVPIPLMSRRLTAALQAAGVDNLQTYETRIETTLGETPPPADHYLAFNIVGLVAAADLQKSMTNPDVTETMNSMDFHTLSIDEAKTQELLLFRLAENITAVLVHERVKLAIEAAGITNLTWFAPEEWAG